MDAITDRPFAPPHVEQIVHVLDLPMPPSTNKIWRSSKVANKLNVHRSAEYKAWANEAGLALLVEYKMRGLKTIPGKFTAIIEIRRDWTAIERNKFDLDNRTKVLFDFCQQHGFIKNDVDLEEYTVKWTHGNAPRGCRITLQSCA